MQPLHRVQVERERETEARLHLPLKLVLLPRGPLVIDDQKIARGAPVDPVDPSANVNLLVDRHRGAGLFPEAVLERVRNPTVRFAKTPVRFDQSGEILNAYAASDPRIRLISQENAGLTRALIRGCAEATAPVIARQDVGDRSLPVGSVPDWSC